MEKWVSVTPEVFRYFCCAVGLPGVAAVGAKTAPKAPSAATIVAAAAHVRRYDGLVLIAVRPGSTHRCRPSGELYAVMLASGVRGARRNGKAAAYRSSGR